MAYDLPTPGRKGVLRHHHKHGHGPGKGRGLLHQHNQGLKAHGKPHHIKKRRNMVRNISG